MNNRYALTLIGFIIWISFFDRNDLISQHSYKNQLTKLQAEKAYYLSEIAKNKTDLNNLVSSYKNLEKFARERYLMKKDDEDIFVIVNEGSSAEKETNIN